MTVFVLVSGAGLTCSAHGDAGSAFNVSEVPPTKDFTDSRQSASPLPRLHVFLKDEGKQQLLCREDCHKDGPKGCVCSMHCYMHVLVCFRHTKSYMKKSQHATELGLIRLSGDEGAAPMNGLKFSPWEWAPYTEKDLL